MRRRPSDRSPAARWRTSAPSRRAGPPTARRVQQPALVVAQRSGASWTITWTIAPAPKPNRNAASAGVERRGADPGAEHRGRAGDQPEHGEPRRATAAPRRAARRSPGPRSCCAARSRRRGRRPARARRRRTTTPIATPSPRLCRPMPTATSSARWRALARPARRALQPLADARQREERDGGADQHERRAAERLRALAGELEALERRVDRQEREQADGQRHHDAQPAGRDAAHPRQPQHPERDRDHADVEAEQRHQAEEDEVVARASRPRRRSRARSSRRSR